MLGKIATRNQIHSLVHLPDISYEKRFTGILLPQKIVFPIPMIATEVTVDTINGAIMSTVFFDQLVRGFTAEDRATEIVRGPFVVRLRPIQHRTPGKTVRR